MARHRFWTLPATARGPVLPPRRGPGRPRHGVRAVHGAAGGGRWPRRRPASARRPVVGAGRDDERSGGMKLETLAVHAGARPDPGTGGVAATLHLATTFERDADGSYPRGYLYGRNANPTRDA